MPGLKCQLSARLFTGSSFIDSQIQNVCAVISNPRDGGVLRYSNARPEPCQDTSNARAACCSDTFNAHGIGVV